MSKMPKRMQDVTARAHKLSWTTTTKVFLAAAPPLRPREICGVIDARASLRRTRRGHHGQVRLVVKQAALDAALSGVTSG